MIKYLTGDVLSTKTDYIAYPANFDGVVSHGIALDIKNKYPNVWVEYKRQCKDLGEGLLGTYVPIRVIDSSLIILPCFTQTSSNITGRSTSLEQVKKVFKQIEKSFRDKKKTVTIPYRYGCGVNNVKWYDVHKILFDIFDKSDVTLQIVRRWEWTENEKVVD